jgi:hypothetical protein
VCYACAVSNGARAHRRAAITIACAALALAPAAAHADASSWMFVGGGAMAHSEGDADLDTAGALSFDVGVGTSPRGVVIVGGLFRIAPLLGSGTDLAIVARGATRGFQAGDFGVALDAGSYVRFWTPETTGGFTGAVVLGAPMGLTLSLQGLVGGGDSLGFGAVAGIDLARLTVYRESGLDYWPNPLPAEHDRRSARGW